MYRFNFVCHGMMVIAERDTDLEILIPEIAPHEYQIGDPMNRKPLHAGEDGEVTGPAYSRLPLRNHLSEKCSLVLKQSALEAVPHQARNRIYIPKPDLVREFRAVEVGPNIFGDSISRNAALGAPHVIQSVVCFSYFNFTGSAVQVKVGREVVYEATGATGACCLYAQPTKAEIAHENQAMNHLLKYKAGSSNPNYKLSLPSVADGAHDVPTQYGFTKAHLLSLYELSNPGGAAETEFAGCHRATLVRGV